jgi:poly(3-hydroxybutyrate) depolymerase
MYKLLILCLAIFALPLRSQEFEKKTIFFEGIERTFLISMPVNYGEKKTASLILAFHGHGGNSEMFSPNLFALNQLANQNNTIMVYPDGSKHDNIQSWNAYHCCGSALAKQINDVGFVDYLIEYLQSLHNIDQKRIFAIGSSNGGMLCHRLAAEFPDRFAAIVVMSGCIGGIPYPNATVRMPTCPAEKISLMMVHGAKDPIVLFNEDWATSTRKRKDISFQDGADFWKNGFQYTKNVSRTYEKEYAMMVFKPEEELELWPRTLQTLVYFETGHQMNAEDLPFILNTVWDFFQKNPKKIEIEEIGMGEKQ